MAQMILSNVGNYLGSQLPGVWGSIGGALGQAAGSALGGAIDQRLFSETLRRQGARLTDLHVQTSSEGASLPALFGRVRIAGQVIWSARFKERVETTSSGGGGKGGGARVKSTNYRYSLSFAVGLCEGEVARIGRAWANGEPFDLSQCAWRLHKGGEDQAPDALIEAIEGVEHAPAYRGLAYIVFEDLPLERFGNVIPQLSFEIVRPVLGGPRLEDHVKGVCLIPGAGEFVYATTPVARKLGAGQEAPENLHAEQARANIEVSLDQLQADFPNCESVLLVTSWFGDDLRCAECEIKPGVEIADKVTTPLSWRVNGVTRAGAYVVSTHGGGPAFGGTPDDASVLEAIAALRARGYNVGLYPFLLMDVPAGNALPDPYGGAAQAAYPWRGRITLDPAPGEPGSPDQTAAAADQIEAFFGAAAPGDFSISAGAPVYAGPAEWSYRRFVLHYAKLAALADVDVFILGSELRGLTTARDGATSFPAVSALQALAADVRSIVGGDVTLTYAADWSEYFGYQPRDGSDDVLFHLDPLWADANIDVVGVDWYPPLADWREGASHIDAALATHMHDGAYLESRIEAGEAYEWHYASEEDRTAQIRTPITDGAYDEPWIYRAKDIRNFWSRAHHDRPGGVREATPTAWIPQSKPIWLIELGCPAVDKGANAPNLFVDAKSAESALPPFSTGGRDDLIQRRTLEAYLSYWADPAHNPLSSLSDERMIGASFLWCWDARPHPAFPARSDVWADGPNWRLGHWLNGRAGLSGLSETVAALCQRAGVEDADVSGLRGIVNGYVLDSPASARDALEPLMAAYDVAAGERDGRIVFFHRNTLAPTLIARAELAAESAAALTSERADSVAQPIEARVRFIDPLRDYLAGGVSARRLDRAEGGVVTLEAPLVLEADAAELLAQAVLADRRAGAEGLALSLGPAHVALEPGDCVRFADGADTFEIVRAEDAETRRLELRRARAPSAARLSLAEPAAPAPPAIAPTPEFALLDVPALPGMEDDERPLAAVFAAPWLGAHAIYAGVGETLRASAAQPAVMGELLWALWPGPVDRWDDGNRIRVKLHAGALASVSRAALLNGANVFAIEGEGGEWEIVQARTCMLTAPGEYELAGFLRGRLGSAHAMRAPHPVGARIVVLDQRLARVSVLAHEWREPLRLVAPPCGGLAGDARAAVLEITPPRAAQRPWAPAHLRARRIAGGDVAVNWVRCARIGGDSWAAGEPPLGAPTESYRLEVLSGADVVRAVETETSGWTYAAANQTTDFGELPATLSLRVAQIDASGRPGLNTELTITL
jgi:hypothetical protein